MVAFEQATSLKADEYWIEARPGGAPSWTDNTKIARLAHREGAVYMGWAAHGDICSGFPGETNSEMLRKLERAARQRSGNSRARRITSFLARAVKSWFAK
jgi:hypothetical protein